ncbi:MAG: hypothetical protein U1F77_16545 [Kiritimatiellia bacterium]
MAEHRRHHRDLRFLTSAFTSSSAPGGRGGGSPGPRNRMNGCSTAGLTRRNRRRTSPRTRSSKSNGKSTPEIVKAFRSTDDPREFTASIDVFFGGGQYDHDRAARRGHGLVAYRGEGRPAGGLAAASPGDPSAARSGEEKPISPPPSAPSASVTTPAGPARRHRHPPAGARPRYQGQVGVADPLKEKSGSIAKTYEMIIHQVVGEAVTAAGFDATPGRGLRGHRRDRLSNGQLPRASRRNTSEPSSADGWTACTWCSGSAATPVTSPIPPARSRSTSGSATPPSDWPSISTRASRPR